MIKISLFLLKSGAENADIEEAVKSVTNKNVVPVYFYHINSISEINEIEKQTDWFVVMYDNEIISPGLMDVLSIYLEHSKRDALVLFKKKNLTLTKAPRVFRRHIELMPDNLLPVDTTTVFEVVLDGWVKELS